MGNALLRDVEYTNTTCFTCGIHIFFPPHQEKRLRESHAVFYCLSGHGQSYSGKSDVEVLREKLAAETVKRERAVKEKEWAEQEARYAVEAQEKAAKKAKRLERRLKHGVCPCCKRTFKQLAAHIASKHPGFAKQERERT